MKSQPTQNPEVTKDAPVQPTANPDNDEMYRSSLHQLRRTLKKDRLK